MYADAVGTVRSHTWRTPVPRVDSRWGHRYSLSKFPSVGRIRGGGFSSPRHQGGGPCNPALARVAGLDTASRSFGQAGREGWTRRTGRNGSEPAHPGIVMLRTVVTCSGRIGTRWGRTVAGLVDGPPEWPKLCNARLRGVDDRRRVGRPWAMGHGPWPRALGRHRALKH